MKRVHLSSKLQAPTAKLLPCLPVSKLLPAAREAAHDGAQMGVLSQRRSSLKRRWQQAVAAALHTTAADAAVGSSGSSTCAKSVLFISSVWPERSSSAAGQDVSCRARSVATCIPCLVQPALLPQTAPSHHPGMPSPYKPCLPHYSKLVQVYGRATCWPRFNAAAGPPRMPAPLHPTSTLRHWLLLAWRHTVCRPTGRRCSQKR